MVTEIVEIEVRERGAQRASRGIRGIGRTAKVAAVAVGGLLAALAALAAFRGLANIASDAVLVSAEFEQLEIRLRTLLGSQEEANTALENFTRLAARTPFSVQQIVSGAATLASVALGNREALESLTETAANLAAVTGLSFQEAASNLQRALAGGIGAADLFRERGVRQLIESINGIPDATQLSLQELEQAFLDTFGADGTFGTAAADLANTLQGSLSNIGDAFTNLQDAIGDAFAPAVIGAARQVIIPFLERLEQLVRENDEEIRDFALDTLAGLIRALAVVIRVTGDVIAAFTEALNVLRGLEQGIIQFRLTALSVGGTIAESFGFGDEAVNQFAALTARFQELERQGVATAGAAEAIRESARGAAAEVDNLADAFGEIDLPGVGAAPPLLPTAVVDPEAAEREARAREDAERAAERIAAINDRLAIQEADRISKFDAQLERLRQQGEELDLLAQRAGETTEFLQAQERLTAEIAAVEAERAAAIAETNRLLTRTTFALEDFLEGFRGDFAEGLSSSIREAVTGGDALDIADIFAQTLGNQLERVLSDTLENVFTDAVNFLADSLTDTLGDSLSGLGGGGGLGNLLGGALAVGGLFAANALAGSDQQVTRSTVGSAVNQTAPVRGVIAGPTNIPVFQVGNEIEAAFGDTNGLLQQLVSLTTEELLVLRGILNRGNGAGGGSTESEAANLFTTTIPSVG